ncbi:MAG: purine/pyrimidine permease, partial [Sporomusa sp.]
MSQIDFKYKTDEQLPWIETGLYGLQWFMISVPLVIILGQVGGGIHYPHNPQLQLLYLQKLFFVTGATMLLQLIWGHKLPIIVGPASVLLIGIIANSTTGDDKTAVIYSTMALCGLALSVLGAWGMVGRLTALFTPCISGIVLLLIAFTMLPTVLHFITAGPDFSFAHGVFAFCLLFAILLAQRMLPDLLRSTVII